MISFKEFGLIVVLATISSGVFAGSGYYVGADVGRSNNKDACIGLGSCNDSDTVFSEFVGDKLNDNLAFELGHTDLGNFSDGPFSGKAHSWDASALLGLPIHGGFSVYGRGGLTHQTVDTNFANSSSNTGWVWGLGANWSLVDHMSLRAEYRMYKDVGGGATAAGHFDIDIFSMGVTYSF